MGDPCGSDTLEGISDGNNMVVTLSTGPLEEVAGNLIVDRTNKFGEIRQEVEFQ